MLAPWIRTSKDCPLSTRFSLVLQSPSPSPSALIPTASPATSPLRKRPPSNSPLRCCPLNVCHTEILSGHSDGKGGKRTAESLERGWAGKEQPFLGLKILLMSLLSANELRVEMPPSQTGKGNSVGCCVGADLGSRSFCWLRRIEAHGSTAHRLQGRQVWC